MLQDHSGELLHNALICPRLGPRISIVDHKHPSSFTVHASLKQSLPRVITSYAVSLNTILATLIMQLLFIHPYLATKHNGYFAFQVYSSMRDTLDAVCMHGFTSHNNYFQKS